MASYVVDGLVLPFAVGGHPALDFCNTRTGWGTPEPKEYLRTYPHLARWAVEQNLIQTAPAAPDPSVLARAIAFRGALHEVLVGTPTEDDWDQVNAEVRAAAAVASLAPDATPDHTRAGWRLAGSGPEAPLLAVAWSAAGLLTSAAAASVRACPGEGCGWIFADPRGRRRWCSMAWCGNRAKARRHAQRRRTDADPTPDEPGIDARTGEV